MNDPNEFLYFIYTILKEMDVNLITKYWNMQIETNCIYPRD